MLSSFPVILRSSFVNIDIRVLLKDQLTLTYEVILGVKSNCRKCLIDGWTNRVACRFLCYFSWFSSYNDDAVIAICILISFF